MAEPHPLVVCLAGAGSATGQAMNLFSGLIHYLCGVAGYRSTDFVEASYRINPNGAPLPYRPEDRPSSLLDATHAIRQCLAFLQQSHHRRLHLLGWSLGGTVLFDAAAALVRDDPTWTTRIGAIVTISSPLLGSDLDGIHLLGELAAGPIGADLARRAQDDQAKQRVRNDAARLRQCGIRLVTLASEDDAVVTPADAIIPALGPHPAAFILHPRRRSGGSTLENLLGHGALPRDPLCWPHVKEAFGPAVNPGAG